jgi:hypothetical protein
MKHIIPHMIIYTNIRVGANKTVYITPLDETIDSLADDWLVCPADTRELLVKPVLFWDPCATVDKHKDEVNAQKCSSIDTAPC